MALIDGLISYWKLDEASGERVDAHASNDLTDNNTVGAAAGIINDGALFVRANDEYLSISDAAQSGLGVTSAFTVSFWIYISTDPTSGALTYGLFGKYNSSTDNRSYALDYRYDSGSGQELQFQFISSADGADADETLVGVDLGVDTLHHVVVRFSSGNHFKIDVDDVSILDTSAPAGPLYDGTAPFLIGNDLGVSGRALAGLIDEFGIWDRSISDAEVTELYNSGAALAYPFTVAAFAISGTVTLSGSPVDGATVRCIRQSDNVAISEQITDSSGEYIFSDLEETELYHLAVEYETVSEKYNALSYWDVVPVEVE